MKSYMANLVNSEGLSEKIIKIVNNSSQKDEPNFDHIYSYPAVRVCETIVTGIPDDIMMRNTLRTAKERKCFLDDMT